MTRPRPKTIQIFLPDGNPRSVRIAEITSRTVRAVEVPRARLDVAARRDEARQVGVYFLFGEDEDAAKPRVYVGESEDCLKRLGQHAANKDWWSRAVVVTSKTNRFDKGQARWLEWHASREATSAGRYGVENLSASREPYLTEPVVADLLDTFETVRILLATLGFPLFEHSSERSDADLFVCEGRGVRARGMYTEDGLVVLRGSHAARSLTKSVQGTYLEDARRKLMDGGVLRSESEGGPYVFAEDYVFSAPSRASSVVLGRSSNGWREWKDGRGVALGDRYGPNAIE